ncbi:MAG: hypothetical protein ACK49D_03485 [Flavobacteriia bacterium]|jgi:hypothetical protein
MSKVDVSIWGIRAGFEDSGIFHSHNFTDVKDLQKDIYRGLADLSRPRNAYIVNRTSSHTVVTILHTDSFEYVAAGNPRSGYVAISLTFDKNKALSTSPRTFLQQFVQWYKSVQGNTRVNNFTAEQIQGIVAKLVLVDARVSEMPGSKAIPFRAEEDLDSFLTGGSKYVPFTETIFYDANVDFQNSGLRNEIMPMLKVIEAVDTIAAKAASEAAAKAEQQRLITEKETELINLKNAGQIDQMLQSFDAFAYNQLLRSDIRSIVETEKKKRAKEIESKEDERRAQEIRVFLQSGNEAAASSLLGQLRDHNRLSDNDRRTIQKFRDDERKKKNEEDAAREDAARKEKKKRKFLTYSIVTGLALILLTVTISILLEFPVQLYDRDGDQIVNSEDECPQEAGESACDGCPDGDKDGIADSKDWCKNEKGSKKLHGCLDSDNDGISDSKEKTNGTDPKKADSDGDGVDDKADACPNEKGIKENKGCPESETTPAPEDDFDENKKVDIIYNGNTYTIKQGFTSEKGMLYNNVKWRYYQGTWQKQEVNDASEKWTKISEADINHILKNCATKKKKTGSGGTESTRETGGTIRPNPPTPPAGKVTTEEDYLALKNLFNDIKLRNPSLEKITNTDRQLWDVTYAKLTKGKTIAEAHDKITGWNGNILNRTVE